MNVVDSAHRTVHAYPGGSESLGPRIGMSPAVLRNKVNPNSTSHHLTLAEADQIMGVTGDYRILQDLASNHGYGLYRLDLDGASSDVIGQLLKTNAAKGEFAQELQAALEDQVVTRNEFLQLQNSAAAVQASMVLLLKKLRAAARAPHE